MSFSPINKLFLILTCLVILSACSGSKSIYSSLNTTNYEIPIIENFDKKKIAFTFSDTNNINFENKVALHLLKNKSQYQKNIIINNNKIITLDKDNNLQEFNLSTGQLTSTKKLNILNIENEIIVSLSYFNDSIFIALKSGSIFNMNLNGDLIWKFVSNKILNTPLFILNGQIIALYVDEIKNISTIDGSLIWSENYKNQPIYQAKGGQIVNFLNLLFFVLPNNRVGSIDLNFGEVHNFVFNEIPLLSPINNTEDKIHIFDNYFAYLDEGKYLYNVDILSNKFTLFKKNVKLSSSNIFFNNSLILKEGNYLHAINIENGKSFWLIESKDISVKSKIIAIRNFEDNIEIFLNNGDILIINNSQLIEIKNLDIKNIQNIIFEKKNIIVNSGSGKTLIF